MWMLWHRCICGGAVTPLGELLCPKMAVGVLSTLFTTPAFPSTATPPRRDPLVEEILLGTI